MRVRAVSSVLLSLATAAVLVAAPVSTHASPAGAGTATAQNVAAAQTVTARYGPYTLPAHSMTGNQFASIPRPCQDCYISSMRPDLVYQDGSSANYDTGVMLHHAVFLNSGRTDATCSSAPGERFFASGNERTVFDLPAGYGYRVSSTDRWSIVADLMNMSATEQTVYIQVTYTVQSATSNLTPVRPVWLDIDQCGDSEYTIPAGVSDTHWNWTVNVPGRVVLAAGHLHDDGVRIEATNETAGGASICNSVARYGETPAYVDMMGEHLSSMSTCAGDPVATVRRGDVVRLHSIYDSAEPQSDVMGIMVMYIA